MKTWIRGRCFATVQSGTSTRPYRRRVAFPTNRSDKRRANLTKAARARRRRQPARQPARSSHGVQQVCPFLVAQHLWNRDWRAGVRGKNAVRLLPANRCGPRATIASSPVIPDITPIDLGAGFPLALLVLIHMRTGPKEASNGTPPFSKQLWISPTNGMGKSGRVMPTGVLQHVVYQRMKRPFLLKRACMRALLCLRKNIVTRAGRV